MNRREYLKKSMAGAALVGATGLGFAQNAAAAEVINDTYDRSAGVFTLPELGYSYDALEPYIDAKTMELHHSRHHQGYVNGLNNALEKMKEARENDDFSTIKHWSRESTFHGGGHFLHAMFWKVMSPRGGGEPTDRLLMSTINRNFGSFEHFKKHFIAASTAVEGSGWGMLSFEPHSGRLIINQAERQSDLTMWVSVPLLMVDVWEHAYYLKYQNRRAEYVENFFNVIDWNVVSQRLSNALG